MAKKKRSPATKPRSVLSTAQTIANTEVQRLLDKSKESPLTLEDARLLEIYTKLIISKRESAMKMAKDQLARVSAMSDDELRDLIKKEIDK